MTSGGTGSLAGRRAIVTGAAGGIGAATATRLAAEGAAVVVADVDEAGGTAVAERIGGRFARLDVGDPEAWERALALFGPFDLAVLNAGVATERDPDPTGAPSIVALPDAAYRRVMAVNVDGVVYGMRAVLPAMLARGHGDISVTASIAGLVPLGLDPVYTLSKHAVVGFVRSVAAGIAAAPGTPDVCVSSVCPGFADTGIIGDGARDLVAAAGLELMSAEHVAGGVVRSLTERVAGAQWVIWPGAEPHVYEWNLAIPAHPPTDVG